MAVVIIVLQDQFHLRMKDDEKFADALNRVLPATRDEYRFFYSIKRFFQQPKPDEIEVAYTKGINLEEMIINTSDMIIKEAEAIDDGCNFGFISSFRYSPSGCATSPSV